MANIKSYKFLAEGIGEVTFKVNHDIMTDTMFEEVNMFFVGAADRLKRNVGNLLHAVLRMYANSFFDVLHALDPVGRFNITTEGFYPLGSNYGIAVSSFERIELDESDITLLEVKDGV